VLMLANKTASVLGRVRASCREFKLQLRGVHNVYPSADPTLVAWSHPQGRRRLPHGGNPVGVGLVLLTPWTAIRIARWVARGKLDMLRPMMIAWPEAGSPMTLAYAMAGQPLASVDPKLAALFADAGTGVVFGNPMTGRKVPSSEFRVLSAAAPDTHAKPSAESPNAKPETRNSEHISSPIPVPDDELLVSVLPRVAPLKSEPCISCGWCAEVCPTSLRPVHLMQLAERGRHDHTLAEHLDWCINCGLCSHVCPVSLPLAQTLQVTATGLKR
jgi:Na+-translocating ferredoxin:NAD+ oxidoreductase RnfC subunit